MRLKVAVCIVAGAFVASAKAISGIHTRAQERAIMWPSKVER